ncbi:CMD domain-containing protein, partial [Achromobacter ruhlandii]|uniref:CMD domain-containing protein n=1 Tax=Achromobacter ruhlandii TaxID=72557 RepID=UPI003D202DDF
MPGGATRACGHAGGKAAAGTQGGDDALLDPAGPCRAVAGRLLGALDAAGLTPAPALAAHYRQRLVEAGASAADIQVAESGKPADAADPRLAAILEFTRKLIEKPVEGDEAALKTLPAAGVSTPAVVTLSQLVAFLSYQVRLVAGLQAMLALETKPIAAGTPPAPFPANTAATEP